MTWSPGSMRGMKLLQIVKTDVPASYQVVEDRNIPALVVKPPIDR